MKWLQSALSKVSNAQNLTNLSYFSEKGQKRKKRKKKKKIFPWNTLEAEKKKGKQTNRKEQMAKERTMHTKEQVKRRKRNRKIDA